MYLGAVNSSSEGASLTTILPTIHFQLIKFEFGPAGVFDSRPSPQQRERVPECLAQEQAEDAVAVQEAVQPTAAAVEVSLTAVSLLQS